MPSVMHVTAVFALVCVLGFPLAARCMPYPHTQIDPRTPAADGPFTVHIVPHTHDDCGWLKTFDEYYYGRNQQVYSVGVQYILDNMIPALELREDRTFTYVEMGFFERWWRLQDTSMRDRVRQLVADGRLDIVGGGISMNDEAATTERGVVSQMSRGMTFVANELNFKPRVVWQIDPFGHASSQAEMFAAMGFEALFISRIHYEQYTKRLANREMEFMWQAKDRGSDAPRPSIYTQLLYGKTYCYPHGFAWGGGQDPGLQPDPSLPGYDLPQRAAQFVGQMRLRAHPMRTQHVMVPWGCDFQWENPAPNYQNLDVIMKYINERPVEFGNVTVKYSTLSRYMSDVQAAKVTFPTYEGDFFPYADGRSSWWTGYYTSRPALKGAIRAASALQQSVSHMLVTVPHLIHFRDKEDHSLRQALGHYVDSLTVALGIAQHHDAVTGTAKFRVVRDYERMLAEGSEKAYHAAGVAMCAATGLCNATARAEAFLSRPSGAPMPDPLPGFQFCPTLNESRCDATDSLGEGTNATVAVVVYNALSSTRHELVRIPVPLANVEVISADGTPLPCDVVSNVDTNSQAHEAPYVVVTPVTVPAMGWTTIWLRRTPNAKPVIPTPENSGIAVLENDHVRLTFDAHSKGVMTWLNKATQTTIKFQQELRYYLASNTWKASGAYVFAPSGESYQSPPQTYPLSDSAPSLTRIKGNNVNELVQCYEQFACQIFRLPPGQPYVEWLLAVPPLSLMRAHGPEVIWRVDTNISSNGVWWTDAQARHLERRQFNGNITDEPIAGNYAPFTSILALKDDQTQLTVLTDRSRGSSSLKNGQLEMMIHRLTTADDGKGLDEAMRVTQGIVSVNNIIVGPPQKSPEMYRKRSRELNTPLVLGFLPVAPASVPVPGAQVSSNHTHTALLHDERTQRTLLPESFAVSSLELNRYSDTKAADTLILRLGHLYDVDEDVQSRNATFRLYDLFADLDVLRVEELDLSATFGAIELTDVYWGKSKAQNMVVDPASEFKLAPLQVRTFAVQVCRYEECDESVDDGEGNHNGISTGALVGVIVGVMAAGVTVAIVAMSCTLVIRRVRGASTYKKMNDIAME